MTPSVLRSERLGPSETEGFINVPCFNGTYCVGGGLVKVKPSWLVEAQRKGKKGPYCWKCRKVSAEDGYSAKMFTP